MSRERGNQMAKKNEEVNEDDIRQKETEKTAEPKEAEKSNEEVLEEKAERGQTEKDMRARMPNMTTTKSVRSVKKICVTVTR